MVKNVLPQTEYFFKNMGWIEKYGSGISRIMNYFKEAGLPKPKFGNISGGFQVTIFSQENVTENNIENVTETENKENEIIDLINKNNYISTTEIAEKLSVSRMTIHRYLEKLKSKGLIGRVGADKGGYWRVK